MALGLHQISLLSRQAKQGCGLQMKLGCFGGSVTASEEFHLALKQRSRVILPFSSALLNLNSSFVGGFRPCNNEALAGAPPGAKVPLREFFPLQRRVLCQRRKVAGIHRQSPIWQRGVLELPCIEETFAGVFLRMVKKVGLERVVKDVLMRLWGVQKGCVKIAELIVSVLFAPVAQRIERRFPKPCVGGSSPLGGARIIRNALGGPFLLSVARYGK